MAQNVALQMAFNVRFAEIILLSREYKENAFCNINCYLNIIILEYLRLSKLRKKLAKRCLVPISVVYLKFITLTHTQCF